jgi:hypothetical protein
MSRYEVNWDYKSGAHGPWEAGTYVELDLDQAEHVNRDSPGVLTEVDPEEQARAKRAKQQEPAPPPAAEPPAESANKPEWVEFAAKHGGLSKADAEALTKDQLVDRFGKKS